MTPAVPAPTLEQLIDQRRAVVDLLLHHPFDDPDEIDRLLDYSEILVSEIALRYRRG